METTIQEAQRELTDRVMAIPGVVGTAIGECGGRPCIKVLVATRTEALARQIPTTFRGHRVVVDETGEIRGPRPIP